MRTVQELLDTTKWPNESVDNTSTEAKRCTALLFYVHARYEEDLKLCLHYCQESLGIYRMLADRWWCAQLLTLAGRTMVRLGNYEEAKDFHQESLAIRRNLGEPLQIATSAQYLSHAYALQGKIKLALQTVRLAAIHFQAAGDAISKAERLRNLGTVYVLIGYYAEALPQLEQSLPLQRTLNRTYAITHNLGTLCMAHMHLGDYNLALGYLQESMTLSHSAGYWREYAAGLLFKGSITLAKGNAKQANQNLLASVSLYRQLQYNGELGWALGAYSLALLFLGDHRRAQECLAEGLTIAKDFHLAFSTCVPVAAILLIEMGKPEAAIQAYATASKYAVVGNSRWTNQVIGQRISSATEALPVEDVRAAQARGEDQSIPEAIERLLGILKTAVVINPS